LAGPAVRNGGEAVVGTVDGAADGLFPETDPMREKKKNRAVARRRRRG
jgi:hypothetical protein